MNANELDIPANPPRIKGWGMPMPEAVGRGIRSLLGDPVAYTDLPQPVLMGIDIPDPKESDIANERYAGAAD